MSLRVAQTASRLVAQNSESPPLAFRPSPCPSSQILWNQPGVSEDECRRVNEKDKVSRGWRLESVLKKHPEGLIFQHCYGTEEISEHTLGTLSQATAFWWVLLINMYLFFCQTADNRFPHKVSKIPSRASFGYMLDFYFHTVLRVFSVQPVTPKGEETRRRLAESFCNN